MKTLKMLAVLAVIGIGVALAQVPVKIGSLTRVAYAPGNSVLMITLPGVTNYAITVEDFKLNTIGSMMTNTVVINNSTVTNQTVYQTNINNYAITTNLTVVSTNANNVVTASNIIIMPGGYGIVAQGIGPVRIGDADDTVDIPFTLNVSNLIVSNNITANTLTANGVFLTNRTITIATNTTSATLNFLGVKDWYDCPTLMETNLTLSPTNLMAGREIWVFFTAANGNYDVTITNTSGTAIRWNMNGATNGSTSFTVTNGQCAELVLTCRTNNIIHAVYGQYR